MKKIRQQARKQFYCGLSASLLLVVGGCSEGARESEELTVDGSNNNLIVPQVAPPTTPGALTAQAWVDDFSIGKSVDAAGVVTDEEDAFLSGDTVHFTMQVDDAPAGAAITVRWLGPNDAALGDETKTVAGQQEVLAFTHDTSQWLEGDYRAEVWVGDEKVNEQHFQIVKAGA